MTEEIHLEILERLAGREAEYTRIGEIVRGPVIFTAHWLDLPEPGLITGFTVGLSAHPRWRSGVAPELIISVESTDPAWVFAIGVIAEQAGNEFSFGVGETVDFRERISENSEMSAFLIMHQMILPEEYGVLETKRGPVALRQMIPLYSSELRMIREVGPSTFISEEPEPANVVREPLECARLYELPSN